MARFDDDETASAQVRHLGEALARLRIERGLSQAEAGQRAGMSSQGWGLYEAGKRPGLFRPDVQRRMTAALEATPEDLNLLMASLTTSPPIERQASAVPASVAGMAARGRGFEAAPSLAQGATQRLQLETDELSPWASAGTILEYLPGRWPRRDQGCVISLKDGSHRARLFVRSDEGELVVRGAGALLTLEKIQRTEVVSVSAVVARLDD